MSAIVSEVTRPEYGISWMESGRPERAAGKSHELKLMAGGL